MSVDLSVDVAGLRLRSPVLAASGAFGYGTEVPLLDRRALGGDIVCRCGAKPVSDGNVVQCLRRATDVVRGRNTNGIDKIKREQRHSP